MQCPCPPYACTEATWEELPEGIVACLQRRPVRPEVTRLIRRKGSRLLCGQPQLFSSLAGTAVPRVTAAGGQKTKRPACAGTIPTLAEEEAAWPCQVAWTTSPATAVSRDDARAKSDSLQVSRLQFGTKKSALHPVRMTPISLSQPSR